MKLHAAVGVSLINSRGSNSPEISVAYTRALEIAESLDDAEYRLRALWGLWAYHIASSRHRVALELAQRFNALAAERPDPNDRLSGEVIIGVSLHYLGDLRSAKLHLQHGLVGYVTPDQTSHIIRFHTDQRVVMSAFLGRVLWLQGFPDQATRAATAARSTLVQLTTQPGSLPLAQEGVQHWHNAASRWGKHSSGRRCRPGIIYAP